MWLGATNRSITAQVSSFSVDFTVLGNQNPMLPSQFLHGQTDLTHWRDMQISSGRCCAAAFSSDSPPPYNDAMAWVKPSVFTPTNNQYAERTIYFTNGYDPPGAHEGGVFVCGTVASNSVSCYEFYWSATNAWGLIYWPGTPDVFSPITTTGAGPSARPKHGDIQRLERVGNTLTLKIDSGSGFVTVATGTDSNLTGGQCGLQHYAESVATLNAYGSQSFRCGNL